MNLKPTIVNSNLYPKTQENTQIFTDIQMLCLQPKIYEDNFKFDRLWYSLSSPSQIAVRILYKLRDRDISSRDRLALKLDNPGYKEIETLEKIKLKTHRGEIYFTLLNKANTVLKTKFCQPGKLSLP